MKENFTSLIVELMSMEREVLSILKGETPNGSKLPEHYNKIDSLCDSLSYEFEATNYKIKAMNEINKLQLEHPSVPIQDLIKQRLSDIIEKKEKLTNSAK